MSKKLASKIYHMDTIKWIFVLSAMAMAVVANQYFVQQALLVRVLGLVGLGVAALIVALTTHKGKQVITFAQEAHVELRKVVWPTRQETIQTTLMVLGVVTVIGMILWGIDIILLKMISKLIGYGAS
jgi:preprotein translocase subunit SecE